MCPTMVAENPIDLVQDVMPDCSIVAGLSAIASRRLEKVRSVPPVLPLCKV